MFQSYQSKQINPDENSLVENLNSLCGFNRINPNRSIPTPKDFYFPNKPNEKFQSYQSRQINLDRSIPTKEWVFRKFSYN